MRASNEACVRPRRNNLHVYVRAEEAGVSDEEQHRGRLRRHMRLQRTLLREGQSQLVSNAMHARGFRFRFRARCDASKISCWICEVSTMQMIAPFEKDSRQAIF